MNKSIVDQQVRLILRVRRMRVDGLRKLRAINETRVNQKSQEIVELEDALQIAKDARIADEKQSLESLLNNDSVRLGSLVSFIKLQRRGVRQMNEIRQEIETTKDEHELAVESLQDADLKLQKAEKRLIAIEEVTTKSGDKAFGKR